MFYKIFVVSLSFLLMVSCNDDSQESPQPEPDYREIALGTFKGEVETFSYETQEYLTENVRGELKIDPNNQSGLLWIEEGWSDSNPTQKFIDVTSVNTSFRKGLGFNLPNEVEPTFYSEAIPLFDTDRTNIITEFHGGFDTETNSTLGQYANDLTFGYTIYNMDDNSEVVDVIYTLSKQ